ncbi:MAG: hypothetical protein ABI670_02930 [Chloroflexota bacterium]
MANKRNSVACIEHLPECGTVIETEAKYRTNKEVAGKLTPPGSVILSVAKNPFG